MDLRVAAYAVIQDDLGRVLLSHWTGGPAWSMPGGGMDPGEHPLETAVREVREETGYDVEIGELLGVDSLVIPAARRLSEGADAPMQALRIVYRATITGGTLTNEVDGSSDRAEWFDLENIPAQRVSLVEYALRVAGLWRRDGDG